MTLNDATCRNRERAIRALEYAAIKATARGNYFRAEAEKVAANPVPWLDPEGEIRYLMACAVPFNEAANEARAQAAALRAQISDLK